MSDDPMCAEENEDPDDRFFERWMGGFAEHYYEEE